MILKRFSIGLLSFFCSISFADDTELFSVDIGDENGLRPQVLIIFDNSGSMKTEETVTVSAKEAYDPLTVYGDDSKVYWSKKVDELPKLTGKQYLYDVENNCTSSKLALASVGTYTGKVFYWSENKKAKNSKWKKLSNNKNGIFDCNDDDDSPYPVDGKNGPYSNTGSKTDVKSDVVTLYSANYLAWKNSSDGGETKTETRVKIAQDAVTRLISSVPSVDFGLAVFNYSEGGRIVDKVMTRDETQTQALINKVNSLTPDTWTPLCETMYEAYRYYAGKNVYYGGKDYNPNPGQDMTAQASGVYKSPMLDCQERSYIILMTDGEPTEDSGANNKINELTGEGKISNSYMPTLAKWMNNEDIDGNADNGNQHISTYTIGFGQAAIDGAGELLTKTAALGGGAYYPAVDADALQDAFQNTLIDILNTDSSLSSPAVASNNFDRTQSSDSVYYSMFIPDSKSVWQGNIKKLTLNDSGILVDRLGLPAIDADGNIKEDASTYWGGDKDGNKVSEGGVSAMLANITSRNILSDLTGNLLQTLNLDNLKTYLEVIDVVDLTDLTDLLGIADDNLSEPLSWLQGLDVDDQNSDDDKTDYRDDIFADPMHSKPLAITYTESGKQVVRLLVGTNAGFLHMFTDHGETISENWAFIPEELIEKGLSIRNSSDSAEHQYGMDLSPIAIKTYDSSGNVSQIIAIVGMRRGGNSYYALDITAPDAPTLLWKIDSDTSGFEELNQTWSVPTVGSFSYKTSGGTETVSPGIVFGGGYDTNKDSCSPSDDQACNNDSAGRAVYIVNALTGEKIWSVDGASCESSDAHCMQDSIPSQIGILDSDDDGYIDRLYTGDTGGNLWRMDLVGTDTSKWSTIKLASLGGDAEDTDRRFFNAPVIVRTYNQQVIKDDGLYSFNSIAYDGILLSSGDRAHPASSTAVKDAAYLIHDYKIKPTLFADEEGYTAKPTPLTVASLYDITSNPVGTNTGEVLDLYADISNDSGWQYRLTSAGEKSLGQGAILEGTVYFTSFVPNSTNDIGCGITDIGLGWLYAIDLHSGTPRLTSGVGEDEVPVTKIDIGSRVPDTLVVHAGGYATGKGALRLLGVGQGDAITVVDAETGLSETVYTGTIDTQADMMPRRIYSFFSEK